MVPTDGTVGDVNVTKSLEPSLDEQATAALRKWTFKPGTLNGEAVPVQIEVEMSFSVRARRAAKQQVVRTDCYGRARVGSARRSSSRSTTAPSDVSLSTSSE